MNPITIDLSGLRQQFGLAADQIDILTETCIQAVTASVYASWEALAKQHLNSTRQEYLQNLNIIDKGRFAKQIVLTGQLPTMLESGASPFDMKEGFQKSQKVRYTVPKYKSKGGIQIMTDPGGDWYLTIPFRIGTPGTAGQAGFSGEMPQEIYGIVKSRGENQPLVLEDLPSPYDQQQVRPAIYDQQGAVIYDAYQHRNAIYEGLAKRKGVYRKTIQNTYVTFRRAGANSDPLSWIHKGLTALNLADQAVEQTDVETIVENEVITYLDQVL